MKKYSSKNPKPPKYTVYSDKGIGLGYADNLKQAKKIGGFATVKRTSKGGILGYSKRKNKYYLVTKYREGDFLG